MGLVIRFFSDNGEVGIQVPGEENIRWTKAECLLHDGNGAFTESTS